MVSRESARELALQLPDSEEQDHFEKPSFRVAGKIFAQLSGLNDGIDRDLDQLLIKLPKEDQAALLLSDPKTFTPAQSWGHHGWTWVSLSLIDKPFLEELLSLSWKQVAPKSSAQKISVN